MNEPMSCDDQLTEQMYKQVACEPSKVGFWFMIRVHQ